MSDFASAYAMDDDDTEQQQQQYGENVESNMIDQAGLERLTCPEQDGPWLHAKASEAMDQDDGSDDDRKPAAKQLDEVGRPVQEDREEEDDNEDDESSSDESSSGSEMDPQEQESSQSVAAALVSEEGRPLSQYEIQRLERIKRNQQYLEQLGLEREMGAVAAKAANEKTKTKTGRRTKAEILADELVGPRRESMSRQSKMKKLSYAEPGASVRDLFRQVDQRNNDDAEDDVLSASQRSLARSVSLKKNVTDRMDQTIFMEFKRIRGHKRQVEKTATRHFRAAEKEVKFWNKLIPAWERQSVRRLEAEQRAQMGGRSAKEMLALMDKRMPAMARAIKRYDEWVLAKQQEEAFEHRRMASEYKIKMISALDRFPRGIQQAASLLDSVFLECAPNEPSSMKRSTRSAVENQPPTPKPTRIAAKPKRKPPPASPDETVKIPDCVNETLADVEAPAKSKAVQVKQRKRVARNVGGWISPDFSQRIDRTWLQVNRPPKLFDLATYVPQVGDIILYYMSGHRCFLAEYPDDLGKKTKSKLRVPLWERALQLQESEETQSSPWWTKEWLESVNAPEFGCYPLLCRVERAHAEFPPDPCGKIIQRDSDHTTLHFKKPKKAALQKGVLDAKIRLAVTLRPLLPLFFPNQVDDAESSNSATSVLSIPPSFTVVTFPCQLDPFLVPFAWGYLRSHSLLADQEVLISSKNNATARINSFLSFGERLDSLVDEVKRVLTSLDGAPVKNAALERALSLKHLDLPLREARVVLDTLYRTCQPSGTAQNDAGSDRSLEFVDILKRTLPVWRSVNIIETSSSDDSQWISPWCLVPAKCSVDTKSPWRIGEHKLQLDESIRAKVQKRLAAFKIVDWEIFDQPVNEDDAPSYYCAVPIGVAYSIIYERIRRNSGNHGCYYRSVDAIMSDIGSILDCCLLYNSPESDVVATASEFVTVLKYEVAQAIRDNDMHGTSSLTTEKERILSSFRSQGSIAEYLKRPFKGDVHRHWLDRYQRQEPTIDGGAVHTITPEPFQAKDTVMYSRSRHTRFVDGHVASLESDQQYIPSAGMVFGVAESGEVETSEDGPLLADDWVKGEVVWVRASFPKPASKLRGSNVGFCTKGLLQCLSIKFRDIDDVCVMYWRPCLFAFDAKQANEACPGCGLTPSDSFLRLASSPSRIAVSRRDGNGHCEPTNSASSIWLQSLDRCLNVLKKQCISGLYPTDIDPGLTKQNVQDGFVFRPRSHSKMLPAFPRLFAINLPVPVPPETTPQKNRETRGKIWKPKQVDSDVSRLVEVGFLPAWVTSSTGDASENVLFEAAASRWPSPKLSLELVQLRIRSGYYRDSSAIVNDIVEAYLATVFSTISDVVSRKKQALSISSIAQALASSSPNDSNALTADTSAGGDMTEEVAYWANRLRSIRALHSAALVCVRETHLVELLHGFATFEQPKISRQEDPQRIHARQELVALIDAFRKDDVRPTFNGDIVHSKKLVIKYGATSEHRTARNQKKERLLAAVNDSSVTVKVKPLTLLPPTNEDFNTTSDLLPPIVFGLLDYIQSDSLSRIMFGRPGRNFPCARCQVHLRTMLHCRVVDQHTNRDFEWGSEFTRIAGVNDVLSMLDPTRSASDLELGDSSTMKATSGHHDEQDESCEANGKSETGEESKVNPLDYARKAYEVLEMSAQVRNEAMLFLEKPARLSKDFVQEAFPIDPSDGHYIYCVVCGLSGDLLCCDGCPNVVHSDCVALSSLPEGDWFCEECAHKQALDGQDTGTCGLRAEMKDSVVKDSTPFGRDEFDGRKSEKIAVLLDQLRNARPRQKLKSVTGSNGENPGENDDVSVTTVDAAPESKRDSLSEPCSPPDKSADTPSRGKRIDPSGGRSRRGASDEPVEVKGPADGSSPTRKRGRQTDSILAVSSEKKQSQRSSRASGHVQDSALLSATGSGRTRKRQLSESREVDVVESKKAAGMNRNKLKASVSSLEAFKNEADSVGPVEAKPSNGRKLSRDRSPPVRFLDSYKLKT